jgi:hypothetical protein
LSGTFWGSCFGLLVLFTAQVSYAEKTNATKETSSSVAAKPPGSPLLDIQKKLKEIILAKYPETLFGQRPFRLDRAPYSLIIHFRLNEFKPHITGTYGNLSTEEPKNFPADFSEFILRLELTSDYYTYTHKLKFPSKRSEPFGATFMNRYNLEVLPDNVPGITDISETPDHDWLYGAYEVFVKAGLIDDTRPTTCMGCIPLTRMGFAIATARLTDDVKAQETISKKPELKSALKVLQQEFARELAELGLYPKGLKTFNNGKTWPTRYKYLSLNFSYGKGFDPKLRKQIEHTIADYAAAWLKSNSASNAAIAQK